MLMKSPIADYITRGFCVKIVIEAGSLFYPVWNGRSVMNVNWDTVKKVTLWQYEELIQKLQDVLIYPFAQEYYNHSMPLAIEYARRLFADKNLDKGDYPAALLPVFNRLEAVGITDWSALIARVDSREKLLNFLEINGIGFAEVIDVLNYLLRWGLPFRTATRELLDHDDPQEMGYYGVFKEHKLIASFDLLEKGRTRTGRQFLVELTGLPGDIITRVVHRADIARLPYVRRKTILPVCAAGYDTLKKIASAEIRLMEADLDGYVWRTQGKRWDDFKAVIPLGGLITGARALPDVVEDLEMDQ
jgi:hypothetical protein